MDLTPIRDEVTVSRSEFELLLRDKAQLDVILNAALHMPSYHLSEVIDLILKMRGMKA